MYMFLVWSLQPSLGVKSVINFCNSLHIYSRNCDKLAGKQRGLHMRAYFGLISAPVHGTRKVILPKKVLSRAELSLRLENYKSVYHKPH